MKGFSLWLIASVGRLAVVVICLGLALAVGVLFAAVVLPGVVEALLVATR